MSESPDGEPPASWIDGRPREGEALPAAAELDVLADADAGTVTFVARDPETETTRTAWLTADASLVFDVTEMR